MEEASSFLGNIDIAGISPTKILQRIAHNIEKVMKGQPSAIRKLLAAFASGGHVLLEDYPGTGKTTLAKLLARSVGASFKRIQFTPDLLPSDILGMWIFDQKEQKFLFHEGPIFTHILLADEINRASPRTQSALLEAMGEGQVSIDGKRYRLEDPFFVIATQNPIEFRGTYPLPEAQMDRFAMQFSLGYVTTQEEIAILSSFETSDPIEEVNECVDLEEVLAVRNYVKRVRISEEMKRYIVEIVGATRTAPGVQMGASPRASLALMKTSQALALLDEIDFVIPEHIQEIAVPVIAHRIILDSQARFSGMTTREVVQHVLKSVPFTP